MNLAVFKVSYFIVWWELKSTFSQKKTRFHSLLLNTVFIGFLPSQANNSITSDHNTFTNELNNMPNVPIPPSLVGNIADGGHSPNHNSMISSQILGTTPLSQIGCTLPVDPYASKWHFVFCICVTQNSFCLVLLLKLCSILSADQLSPCNSSDEGDSEIDSINDDLSSNVSNTSSKRQKRGILPKQATSVMRAWLFQHLVVNIHNVALILMTHSICFLRCVCVWVCVL